MMDPSGLFRRLLNMKDHEQRSDLHPRKPGQAGKAQKTKSADKLAGTTITRRKIKPLSTIKAVFSKLFGYSIAAKYLHAQSWAIRELEKIRNRETTLPPNQSSRDLSMSLARTSNANMKMLYEGRLLELQKKYARSPIVNLITKGVLWARKNVQKIRKVFGFSSKNIGFTVQQELSKLKDLLGNFEQTPQALIDGLNEFETRNGLQTLQHTLSLHSRLNPDQVPAHQFELLRITKGGWIETPPKLEKQIKTEDNHPIDRKKALFKAQVTAAERKTVSLSGTKKEQDSSSLDDLDATKQPNRLINTRQEVTAKIQTWRQDANHLNIPYPAYINLNPCGILGRLAKEDPILAHKLIQERIDSLEKDIDISFTKIRIPYSRRTQALKEIESVKELFRKINLQSANPDFIPCMNAIEHYEYKFNKRSLQLLLNIKFLDIENQDSNYTEVSKVGFLEGTHAAKKQQWAAKYKDDKHQPANTRNKPFSPFNMTGKYINTDAIFKSTFDENPELIRTLATQELDKKYPVVTALNGLELKKDSDKDELYTILKKPNNKPILNYIKKQLIHIKIINHLTDFEPDYLIGIISRKLKKQLAEAHNGKAAEQLQRLIKLSHDKPNIKKNIQEFINKPENKSLEKMIFSKIQTYFLESITPRISEIEHRLEHASQSDLYKILDDCDNIILLHEDATAETRLAKEYDDYSVDNEKIITKEKAKKIKHQIEQELVWRLISHEQFKEDKDRIYFLALPPKQEFLKHTPEHTRLATDQKNQLAKWFPEWFSDKLQSPDTVIFENALAYVKELRNYWSDNTHANLIKLQQQRFDFLDLQKNYCYSSAIKRISNKSESFALSGNSTSDHIERLKAIDKQQIATAPSRPANHIGGALWGTLQALSGVGKTYDLNIMLDDIRWNQTLSDLNYNFNEEFEKRTGIPTYSHFEKFKQKIGLANHKKASTDDDLKLKPEAVTDTKEIVKDQVEGFLSKALGNLSELRSIARRHPKLFRNTFGAVISIIPTIAGRLGYEELIGNATMLNFQAQNFASEFMGNSDERNREHDTPLTDHDKEWLLHLQFTHDISAKFFYDLHRFDTVTKVGTYALTGLGIGGIYGALAGAGAGLYSSATTAISPMASKAMLDKMPSHHLEYAHGFLGSNAANFMGQMGQVLGNIAEHAPNLIGEVSTIKKVFALSKIAVSTILKPIKALKNQFFIIKRAYREAKAGKAGGWRSFILEVLPVVAIVVGGICAAAAAGISIFLTWGVTAGVFTAALGAFATTSWTLSKALLSEKYSQRTPSQAYSHYTELFFDKDSRLAKNVKRRCLKDATKLAAGELFDHESFIQLEHQELLRNYYEHYWNDYCQQQPQEEQRCNDEFNQWIQNTQIKEHSAEIAKKLRSLKMIEEYLAGTDVSTDRNKLQEQLKKLGIINQLPGGNLPIFLRFLKDELAMFIEFECGHIPDNDHIEEIIKERYRKAYLGYKVKKALSSEQVDINNFEQNTKDLFRKRHIHKIATNAESQIKCLLADTANFTHYQPLARSPSMQPPSDEALTRAAEEGLKQVSPEMENVCQKEYFGNLSHPSTTDASFEDEDEFYDALQTPEEIRQLWRD